MSCSILNRSKMMLGYRQENGTFSYQCFQYTILTAAVYSWFDISLVLQLPAIRVQYNPTSFFKIKYSIQKNCIQKIIKVLVLHSLVWVEFSSSFKTNFSRIRWKTNNQQKHIAKTQSFLLELFFYITSILFVYVIRFNGPLASCLKRVQVLRPTVHQTIMLLPTLVAGDVRVTAGKCTHCVA